MKKMSDKIQKEIIFYAKKLAPIKQIEALDFIKWLWGGPANEREFNSKEIEKIGALAKRKGGREFKDWKDAKKYLESLMG